jgi:formamidopyrimidine-DNA glycosylase
MRARSARSAREYLIATDAGTLILHLGMSGSLRAGLAHRARTTSCSTRCCLRFNDPRRFGCLLYTAKDPLRHRLLAGLAVEPLSGEFDGDGLWRRARDRRASIKAFIMDSRIVAGVGNIYASEALFRAGIRPGLAAARVSRKRMAALVGAIRDVLAAAIGAGGTTLRDYVDPSGTPGYFGVKLFVYERAGQPCRKCRTTIRKYVQGQRSTYWCPRCQR